jgi:tape measure domain-containing protein
MAGAGREAQVKSLQSIEGSAARAMKSLKDLKAIAAQPGIGFDEAIQGYSSLRAVRAPSGLAKSMISEMGNAVALNSGGPEDMKNALRGVSQTFGKGKIQAEELMQILEPAPMIRQAIEKAFGTANSEDLQAMMKRDAMSVTQFWERVVAQMRKLPRAGDGAKNALENVGIAAKELVIVFGQGFMGNDFTAKISAVGAWIGSLEPLARRAGEVLRRVFDQVTDAGGRMAGQFKAAWQALKAGDSNTLSRLSQGSVLLAEGAQKGAAWLQEMGQRAVGAGRQALKFAGDFATAWQMLSGGAVDSDKLMGLDPKAVGAAGGLMQGINRVKEMWGTLTSGNFGGLGEMIGHSLAQVYKLVEPWAVQMATRMAQAGVDVFKGFIAGLRKEFPKLDKFLNDAARLWEEWRPRFQALGDAIGGMIDKHLPGVIKLLDHLLTIAGLMAPT